MKSQKEKPLQELSEKDKLLACLDSFTKEMKKVILEKAKRGYFGWDKPYTKQQLIRLI